MGDSGWVRGAGAAVDGLPAPRGGEGYWSYGVPDAAARWAAHDGCGATPAVSQPLPGVELSAYPACAGGAEVALYTIAGAGHEWPGAPQQTAAVDANAVMWAFFITHPLPCPDAAAPARADQALMSRSWRRRAGCSAAMG
jgi:poly(3-hydroxybutyrate) depolymerase